jgi:TetR/AcrR family transcriptional regulator, fatty acid metabolism regulator protein
MSDSRSGGQEGRSFIETARRAQLVQCAIDTIAEHGYPQATIARIADRAGVSRGVVSYHFAGKDELVTQVVTEVFTAGARVMLPAIAAESTAAGKLAAYIRSNAEYIATHRAHALAMLDIWTSYRTDTGDRLDQAMAAQPPPPELAELDPEWILRLGMETGEFRTLSARSVAIAVRRAIDGAVLQMSHDPKFDIESYATELVTLFDRATKAKG